MKGKIPLDLASSDAELSQTRSKQQGVEGHDSDNEAGDDEVLNQSDDEDDTVRIFVSTTYFFLCTI